MAVAAFRRMRPLRIELRLENSDWVEEEEKGRLGARYRSPVDLCAFVYLFTFLFNIPLRALLGMV